MRSLRAPASSWAFVLSMLLLAVAACRTGLAQTGSVVTIDGDRVLAINGRKVFPITMSPGPPTNGRTPIGDDALRELADAGVLMFRIAQTTDWNSQVISNQQAALDWAYHHGMYCMVNLRELSEFPAGDTATEAALRSMVNRFKSHPALGVWKNSDEAWWGDVSSADLKRGYEVIKQEDPFHPVEQTHAPRGTIQDLQPYNAAADIFAIDIYPVGVPPGQHSLLPNKEISMVGDWTRFLSQVTGGQKHYWMVEQIAWSGVLPPARTLVFPTLRQSRFMAYQAIINGARGLMFFGGNVAATLNAQDAPLGWNWTFWDEVLKPVIREIGDHSVLATALVAPDSTLPITMNGTIVPDIEFTVREAPPYLYIMACKREGVATNVTFSGLSPWATIGEVLYESPRTITAQNGQFTDTFAPFDVHVYRFAQSNQSPAIIFGPQTRTNYPGTPASFTVTAEGTGPLAYQWRRNGTNLANGGDISGVTSPTLLFSRVEYADAGSYDVAVTGSGSATSQVAMLVITGFEPNRVASITTHPEDRTDYAGSTATFSVEVSGVGPFAYQWRRAGTNLINGGNISGATSWRLNLFNISEADAGSYTVVVNGFNSVTSQPAALVIVSLTNQLILYEPFDYPNIGGPVSSNSPANWNYLGSGANDLSVVVGNLSYPGLASPVGNSVTNGGVGLGVRRIFGSSVNSGALFFSALFRINNVGFGVWNGAASQVGALTATDNTSFRLAVMVRSNSPSGYVIGVQKGGTGVTSTFGTTEYHAGDTVFLVGKYDFETLPNRVSLWINPDPSTFGSLSAPAGGFIFASTGTDGFTIDRFNMRQNTAASVPSAMQWDELRIGAAWADVTPPAEPRLIALSVLADGSFQFTYTNQGSRPYTVFASSKLIDWSPVGAAEGIATSVYRFTDRDATSRQRFYRLGAP